MENLPTAQSEQDESPVAKYMPALQLAQLENDVVEIIPRGQSEHCELLLRAENRPGTQLVQLEDNAAENLPAAHAVHSGSPLAENSPPLQLLQLEDDVIA